MRGEIVFVRSFRVYVKEFVHMGVTWYVAHTAINCSKPLDTLEDALFWLNI